MASPISEGGVYTNYSDYLDNLPMTRFHWALLIGVILAQLLDGYNYMSNSFVLPGVIKQFGLTPVQAGSIASVTNTGLLLGALIFAFMSDRFGRRVIFQWVLFTYAFGSLLSALAPNFEIMLVSRFISGFGIGSEFPVAFALLSEYSPKKYRSILIPLGPIAYSTGWVVAGLVSMVAIPHLGWRSLYWFGVAPVLMIIYIRRYAPESVRYLVSRQKISEAKAIIEKIALQSGVAANLRTRPEVKSQTEGYQTRTSWRMYLTSMGPLVALSLLYFCFFIQNFGITAWLPTLFTKEGYSLLHSFGFTLIIFLMSPIGQVFATWLQDRVPRRWAITWLAILGGACFIFFGLAFQYHWPIAMAIVFEMLSIFTATGTIVILYTLGTEMFPTPIRSGGMGIVTAVGRVGAVIGPLFVGMLITMGFKISALIYMLAVPLLIAAIVSLILLPYDTRRKGLDQIETEFHQIRGEVS